MKSERKIMKTDGEKKYVNNVIAYVECIKNIFEIFPLC